MFSSTCDGSGQPKESGQPFKMKMEPTQFNNNGLTLGSPWHFGNGFLPSSFQGSIFRAGTCPVANIHPVESTPGLQRNKLALMQELDRTRLETNGHNDQLESAIANYELAFRMQSAVPDLMDLKGESEATRKLYGLDADYEHTRSFGAQCLVARRLVERGVRFVELTCPAINGADRWDQHGNLKTGHENNARAVDQPIAALLTDLKARGLLKKTLVVWAGEFGRTPFAQGTDGRDQRMRVMARMMLEWNSYRVVETDSCSVAETIWPGQAANIDLRLTAVALPGRVSGRDLADRLRKSKPGLKVLFTCDSEKFLDANRDLSAAELVAKPFSSAVLLARLGECFAQSS